MFLTMKTKPTDKDWGTFGGRMRWARFKAGIPQRDAAKSAGISQPTLSELESDTSKGSAKTPQFAEIYGVDAVWLASGVGTPKPRKQDDLQAKLSRLTPSKRALVNSLIDELLLGDDR